jgi:hypothetical protein
MVAGPLFHVTLVLMERYAKAREEESYFESDSSYARLVIDGRSGKQQSDMKGWNM